MSIEHASVQAMRKPWGVSDLQPWSSVDGTGDAVGELWFERADSHAPTPALLLKLLFTSAPLSIQVHPDDTFARAMGMPNGKSEAWYIISAEAGAQIGVGLNRRVTPQELRAAITNGSIVANAFAKRRRKLDVAAVEEDFGVFLIRRLEDAEGGVIRAINDLNVLHVPPSSSRKRSSSSSGASRFRSASSSRSCLRSWVRRPSGDADCTGARRWRRRWLGGRTFGLD